MLILELVNYTFDKIPSLVQGLKWPDFFLSFCPFMTDYQNTWENTISASAEFG